MKGLGTSFFIVKITDTWNESNTHVIRNEVEILDSYKSYVRAKKHFHDVIIGCRNDMDCDETVYLKDDYGSIVNAKTETRFYLTYDILKWI